MPFFEWDNSLSVGVAEIDDQHRQLIDMINMLHESTDPADRHRIVAVFQGLIEYASRHFSTEEGLMRQADYDGLQPHIAVHQAFVRTVSNYYEAFNEGSDEAAGELAAFMRDWLRDHVKKVDMQYREAFKEKGII